MVHNGHNKPRERAAAAVRRDALPSWAEVFRAACGARLRGSSRPVGDQGRLCSISRQARYWSSGLSCRTARARLHSSSPPSVEFRPCIDGRINASAHQRTVGSFHFRGQFTRMPWQNRKESSPRAVEVARESQVPRRGSFLWLLSSARPIEEGG